MILAMLLAELCAGQYRWAVKTQPLPAERTPIEMTVAELNDLPRPKVGSKSPRTGMEKTLAVVRATVVAYSLEADQDIHLILRADGATMVAEFPDPRCVKDVIAKREIAAARHEVFTIIPAAARGPIYLQEPVPVVVTGAIFFDKRGHGAGHARNGVELHPCKSIRRVTP
jgi:hypothetical protein